MKKILIIISILLVISNFNKNENIVIPKEAIRFRVIANSNEINDQNTKKIIRDTIQKQIQTDLKETNSITQARNTLKNNVNYYENIIENTITENNLNTGFNINYGMNYFPKKVYKGVTYEEGYYESLVVTLGNGIGNNWWCVLFPPLCLLEAEETEEPTKIEYKFFVKELIDKYLK